MYEVYFQKNNRVFYITVDKENIYLLHSCRKQKIKQKKGCKYSTEAGKRIRKYVRQEVYLEGVVNMPFLQVNVEQEIQKQRENDPEFKKYGMSPVQSID